jgi:hypothetical protein
MENDLQKTTRKSISESQKLSGGICVNWISVRVGTEFRPEKVSSNRLGTVSVIPRKRRKKVLIPMHSEVQGRVNCESRNRTKRNYAKKLV